MKLALWARPCMVSAALAAAFPTIASAQAPQQEEQLQPVVVTATRSATREDAVLSDVVVIERTAIEREAGRTLTELIAREAGVQMSANGGLGKNSGLYIRGTESRHVLLLIDGVRYGSATTGAPSWDNIPLEDIERIEVLKGPASALYGSDAVGGVVQIFTRRGREGFHPYASVTAGSYGRAEGRAGLSGGSGNVGYALSLGRVREDGFSSANPAIGSRFNPDDDGFEQTSFKGSVDWTLAPGWKADARALGAHGTSRYDNGLSPFDTRADLRSRLVGAGVEGRVLSAWKSRIDFGHSEDQSTDFSTATRTSRFDTQQQQWLWQNDVDTPVGQVLAGYEHLAQEVDSTTVYDVRERSIGSWFGGLNGTSGAHTWQFNLRRDRNSQFGGADTGLAAYGFKPTAHWRLHASYGTSFKAPTFNGLYYPGFGNPDLLPERGHHSELGTTWTQGAHEFSAVRYDNRIRGFITNTTVAANIPQARIEGWTLGYRGQFGAWGVHSSVDLLDARNRQTQAKLPRRADRQLSAGVDYAVSQWKLGATLLAASDRFDDVANTVPLPGYGTVDLYADYSFSKDWNVQAKLNNAGDKSYETARGYNQAGRSFYLTLRWQPA